MQNKEVSDATLVLFASESVQIDVCRARNGIELLGCWHNCEKAPGFLDRSVTIFGSMDKQYGTPKQ